MWLDIYEQFSELTNTEQLALFDAMKQDLFPDDPSKITKLLNDIREARFASGMACVHCGSTSVKRNGKYKTRQRYLCQDCSKTFNDITNTPFSGSRYPEKWVKYIELMVEGYTLPKIALGSLGFEQLKGIVEGDETFFKESMKGKRKITHREPKERGGKDQKRGISNLKIAVVVAQDRNGGVVARKAGRGRVRTEEIDAVIGEYIEPSALLCTDTATNYKKFALIKGLKHEPVNISKEGYVKKGIYHVQHVNNFHKRLEDWMVKFQGVATKYLDNYLYWFRWLELGKNLAFEKRVEQMLISACQKSNYFTVNNLRSFA